jgi:hypothetical protein
MMELQFSIFEHFLKAPSKDFINRLFLEAFNQRDNSKISESVLKPFMDGLEIDLSACDQLVKETSKLIKLVLYESYTELAQIQNVFEQSSLEANLKKLLSKILVEKIPTFKSALVDNENMMPRLVDFDWRVDIKMASNLTSNDSTSKSGQQTCILQLKNDETATTTLTPPIVEHKTIRTISNASTQAKPILDIYEIIKQQFLKRSEKQLGLMSFYARVYSSDKCGSNGLPLIPNSIRIYGKFQYLKSLAHANLCRYVQIQRGAHERLFIVSEHYSLNLNDLLNDTYIYNLIMANNTIQFKWCHQMLKAFTCLSLNAIVHRNLHLNC